MKIVFAYICLKDIIKKILFLLLNMLNSCAQILVILTTCKLLGSTCFDTFTHDERHFYLIHLLNCSFLRPNCFKDVLVDSSCFF